MGDAPARTELKVTTGPIRGSRKIFVNGVAMRAVDLEPSSGEPPVILYDTSGPYTDPQARIDIMAGLPELRAQWIRGRGDVEEVDQREVRPEDNGQLGPDRSGGVQAFPNVRKRVLRAKPGANVTQMHYARRGIVTPEMEYVAHRENLGREAALDPAARRRGLRRLHPRLRHPRVRPRRGRPRPRHHPRQHQPPRDRADGDRPQLPGQDQRQHRQQRRRLRRRRRGRQDGVVDPLGRRHGHGPLDRPQHPRHPRMDHPQLAGPDRHRPHLPGAGEGRRRRRGADLGSLPRHA